jgi:basic membrane lipoprotein Med (substrate-binding protein (PBP1-ABC) superfamily)
MAENDRVGYVAGYPIFGEPAAINAFALGARMVNPRARVELLWSCARKDCVQELRRRGISVISNRDAVSPDSDNLGYDWGTYKLGEDGELLALGTPCWNWGVFYEKLVRSVLKGDLEEGPADRPINYWFGMDSGVVDIQLSDSLPDGVRSLAQLLHGGLIRGEIDPFRTRILDQNGVLRCSGEEGLGAEGLMRMDWLCDNVIGEIPETWELDDSIIKTVKVSGVKNKA